MYNLVETNIKELEKKRDILQEENAALISELREKKEDSQINDDIAKIYGKTGMRGGIYGNIKNLPNYNEYWKKTVFNTKRVLLETMKFSTLDMIPMLNKGCYNNPFCAPDKDLKANILGYCDMIIPSKNGPILHLIDPYTDYTLPPLKKITFEEATMYSGRLIKVTMLFNYFKKHPNPIGITLLPFTLTEEVK